MKLLIHSPTSTVLEKEASKEYLYFVNWAAIVLVQNSMKSESKHFLFQEYTVDTTI